MRVKITTQDFRLRLYLPNIICLNTLGVNILLRTTKKYIKVSPIQKKELVKCKKTCRKQCIGVTLVEVHSVDGDEIIVSL